MTREKSVPDSKKGKRKQLITDYTTKDLEGPVELPEDIEHESPVNTTLSTQSIMLSELENVYEIIKETESSNGTGSQKKISIKNCQEILKLLDKIRVHLALDQTINKISEDIAQIKDNVDKLNEKSKDYFENNDQIGINSYKGPIVGKSAYSEIAKLKLRSNDQQTIQDEQEVRTVEVKVVSKNDELSSGAIKSAIIKEISPSKLKVQIFSLKPGMKCLYLKVRNEEQAEIVINEIKNKMPLFDSDIVQKIDPCIKVININKATTTNELISVIISQN